MGLKKTFQVKAKLLYNKRVKDAYFRCAFRALEITKQASPGQFISVKIGETLEPLLRRPFSIHRVSGANMEILYEIVGKGTQLLAQKKAGEYLDIIGPLGSGFSLQLTAYSLQLPILVAGGIGVAPLLFLAEELMKAHTAHRTPHTVVLIGAKNRNHILCEKEFKDLGCDVKIATDDGSRGFKGTATDLLKTILRGTKEERRGTIYACGPHPMLKEIAAISKQHNIPAQVSLDEHLACGIGACLGCAVKAKTENRKPRTEFEYKRVCKDGPVFNAKEIIW